MKLKPSSGQNFDRIMLVWILRALTSIILGLVLCLSLVLLLVSSSAIALTDGNNIVISLSDQDAYDRIYTEVLTPETVEKHREQLFGDGLVLSSEELHEVLQTAAPPGYIREQMELNLGLLSSFLESELHSPELYLELDGYLEALAPAMAAVVQTRDYAVPPIADALQTRQPVGPDAAEWYVELAGQALEAILTGKETPALPRDLEGLTESQTLEMFGGLMETLDTSTRLSQPYRESLKKAESDLRRAFVKGGAPDLLARATKVAVELDAKIAEDNIRRQLDHQGRLELVPLLARDALGISEKQLRESARGYRRTIHSNLERLRIAALGLVLLTLAAAVTTYRRSPATLLAWLRWTMNLAGVGTLGLALLTYLVLPGVMAGWIYDNLRQAEGLVPAFALLASEVAAALVRERIAALTWIAVLPLAAGIALWLSGKYLAKRDKTRADGLAADLALDEGSSRGD